jgi:hypothetical protein
MRIRLSGVVALVVLGVAAVESGRAQEKAVPSLAKLAGTEWTGKGVLWFGGPTHDDPNPFDGTVSIDSSSVSYTWFASGKPQRGTLTLGERGATWVDSWHQPKKVELTTVPGAWGLLAVHYTYRVGKGPDWGWRIVVAQRPSGELVLQMTNVFPWGEEARAWRLVVTRKS